MIAWTPLIIARLAADRGPPFCTAETRRSSPAPRPLRHKGNAFSLPCVTRVERSSMADAESDLLRSSLDLLVLKALSWGPMHGYAIGEWVEGATGSVLLLEEGT